MGFEEEQQQKNEGGNDLNEEQVKNIVTQVLTGEREKGQLSQEIGELRKGIKNTSEGLAELRKLFCTPDGKLCFTTQADLDAYMQKQDTRAKELDGKVGEIATQIKEIGQAGKKQTLPGGLQRLPEITAEIRAGMSKEDDEARDAGLKAVVDYFRVSDNDMWKRVEKNPVNLDAIAKKQEMRKRVFDGISDQELKDVTLMACKDGKCRPFREGLEKEAGIKFYAKDKRGRFQPVDQEEKEGPHI